MSSENKALLRLYDLVQQYENGEIKNKQKIISNINKEYLSNNITIDDEIVLLKKLNELSKK